MNQMKFLARTATVLAVTTLGALAFSSTANAQYTSPSGTVYEGLNLPAGEISFADEIVDYTPGNGWTAGDAQNDPTAILGAPDWVSNPWDGQGVSLGGQGSITVKFTDNALTGSGTDADDLWIFEIGKAVEAASIAISQTGSDWLNVGAIGGSTSGVDIDPFLVDAGYDITDQFFFVKITDIEGHGAKNSGKWGADIDAVAAISTQPSTSTDVPEPAMMLGLLAFGGFGLSLRKLG